MNKVGRPRVKDIELNIENKQAILDYINQGWSLKQIAKEMQSSIKPIRTVYNRYIKDVEELNEINRVDDNINTIIELTINPRKDRISKMQEMLNKTVDSIYNNSTNDEGELGALDSGDFAMVLKLLERDEQTLMASSRLQTTKKKNKDSRYMFNKEKMLRVDEIKYEQADSNEEDVLIVEKAIKDVES